VAKKVGHVAASECEIIIHNPEIELEKIGKTSFGTLVSVNKEVMSSDLVIGIGGVYPNQTAGFGGGSKLVLGVLGFHSIMQLHYRHPSMGWGRSSGNNTFHRDLDEIARMVKLRTSISVHIDANREVIRLTCGDPFLTYNGEVEFARKTFTIPPPGDADVVICNAYPSDISLTSVHMKGISPFEHCVARASRIVLASCPEGIGHHGLFPCVNRPKLYRLRHIARRLAIMKSHDLLMKVAGRVHRGESVVRNPIWLYRPSHRWSDLPSRSGEVQISNSWAEIVETIRSEQSGKQHLNVVLYPCAPLQVLE
jgi:nickel-dependent lactate racemase